jgi:peptidoglycan/xylan/chitin deacetylase (PgdA/CDA1 family)
MRSPRRPYLAYHQLETNGGFDRSDPGFVHYVVGLRDFVAQMDWLRKSGIRGMNVSTALHRDHTDVKGVALTFDDGYESDLTGAAPILEDCGFGATFYLVAQRLGTVGFLSISQARELIANPAFEIGSHSMTHKQLHKIGSDALTQEIRESKDRLEQVSGRAVDHFACPGGYWSKAIALAAREAGYLSVVTSREGLNTHLTDPFRLERIPIHRGTSVKRFAQLARGRGTFGLQIRRQVLNTAKSIVGWQRYKRLRTYVLYR